MVARPRMTRQRRVFVGREQYGELALAGHEVIELRRHERAGWEGLATDRPGRTRLDQQPFALDIGLGVVGHIDSGQLAILATQEGLGVIELQRALDEVPLEARREVAVGV